MQTWESKLGNDTANAEEQYKQDTDLAMDMFMEGLDELSKEDLIGELKSLATKSGRFVELTVALGTALERVITCDKCGGTGTRVVVGGKDINKVMDGSDPAANMESSLKAAKEVTDLLSSLTDRVNSGEITKLEAKELAQVESRDCDCRVFATKALLVYAKFGNAVLNDGVSALKNQMEDA